MPGSREGEKGLRGFMGFFYLLHHDQHARYDRMFRFLWIYVLLLGVAGFLLDTPENIVRGLVEIVTTEDALITDYVLVAGPGEEEIRIYGKTGMGKDKGVTVDAWFTGFAEIGENPLYFCVYLGRTDGKDVSSSVARDIAVHLISEGR